MEDLLQEEFNVQMRDRELTEEVQVIQEFFIDILLLCFIYLNIEASPEDSTSIDTERESVDMPPQVASIAFIFLSIFLWVYHTGNLVAFRSNFVISPTQMKKKID